MSTLGHVVCAGELMWDVHGQLAPGAPVPRHVGGAAATGALGPRRSAIDVSIVANVSRDRLGGALVASLEAAGIDARHVRRVPGRSGVVFIASSPRGQSFVSYRPQHDGKLARVAARRASDALLHIAAADPELLDALVALAAYPWGRVVLDVNARPRAWRGRRGLPRGLKQLLGRADVVKISADDVAVLAPKAGWPESTSALRAALRIPGTLIWTRGGRATGVAGPWGSFEQAPKRAGGSLRTVGAGDAFCVGMLTAMLGSWPADARAWRATIARAHATAHAHVTGAGAISPRDA